ncbi:hypothetical protein WJX84_011676 [Apatococcus fuscideae]|uniref:Origin recognition complex subunit 4 n=1 Tax=Apatococcus fuscideae TaxID=2026836 RepID=A0AAW1TA11_9CHLO
MGRSVKGSSAKTAGHSRKAHLESPPKRHRTSPVPAPGHAQEEEDISIELDDVDFPSRPSPNENQAANAGADQRTQRRQQRAAAQLDKPLHVAHARAHTSPLHNAATKLPHSKNEATPRKHLPSAGSPQQQSAEGRPSASKSELAPRGIAQHRRSPAAGCFPVARPQQPTKQSQGPPRTSQQLLRPVLEPSRDPETAGELGPTSNGGREHSASPATLPPKPPTQQSGRPPKAAPAPRNANRRLRPSPRDAQQMEELPRVGTQLPVPPWVVGYLRQRLLDPNSGAAAGMALRPALHTLQVGSADATPDHEGPVRGELVETLAQTVRTPGANHSLLLIGPRGVGKSLVVERALQQLQQSHNPVGEPAVLGVVRLSGLVHSEERTAFREAARQLCRAFDCSFSRAASLEDNLSFMREMMQELHRAHKAVVFVLDEFDLFAKGTRQTLLYNLLDAMQATDMQAAVVGMSCRLDVMEMLEKRVRSRFSHTTRLILDLPEPPLHPSLSSIAALRPTPASGPSTCAGPGYGLGPSPNDCPAEADFPGSILEAMLQLPNEGPGTPRLQAEGAACSAEAAAGAGVMRQAFNRDLTSAVKSVKIQTKMRALHTKGLCSPRDLQQASLAAVCGMGREPRQPLQHHLLAALTATDEVYQSQARMVAGLSVLEMYMLVAVLRLTRKGQLPCNFEQAMEEYGLLNQMQRHPDAHPRPLALRAFERLLACALLTPTDSSARLQPSKGLKEFQPVMVNVTKVEVEQGMRMHGSCPPLLQTWLVKDVVTSGNLLM